METEKILFSCPGEAARLCNGNVYLDNSKAITNVVISSADAKSGSLFVAFKGERTDGFCYIRNAANCGATAVLVPSARTIEAISALRGTGCAVIAVSDTLNALQSLAAGYCAKFDTRIIGITGSCGKTTTKEILASILGIRAKTAKTPGNMNSMIGLPLSVFNLDASCKYGVFELGIDHKGEMDRLCSIIRPETAVLTNICCSHLEKFGDKRTLVNEKAKIFSSAANAFISEECEYKNYISRITDRRFFEFGPNSVSGVESVISLGLNGWIITYCGVRIHLNCIGWHSVVDCLCAIAVARIYGISAEEIAEGVAAVDQISGRSKVYSGDVTVIDDSYNANLQSSCAIVDTVDRLSWEGRKNVAFGSMKELGSLSAYSHRQLGKRIAASGIDNVYLFGNEMTAVRDVLREDGFGGKVFWSADFDEVSEAVSAQKRNGDLFVLKGSRVMRMERLLDRLIG